MGRKSYERGLATRRKVLGDAWVDRALATATPFNADFQEMITRYAWDGVWNRPGLPHDVRRMLVVAMTVALGRWEEYELHVRAGLDSGELPAAKLKEVLLQSAIYCGVPAANTAFRVARGVLEERGAGKAKPDTPSAPKRRAAKRRKKNPR